MKKIVILIVLFVFSCSVPVLSGQIKLNYRLKWLFNASVAGDIYADAKGFFDKAGLKVNVKEGSPEKNAINELELKHADFGVASADQVIRALDKGAKIVVIAQLFQINPMQWIYRADQPEIKKLEDLKGRNIGVTFGGNDETIMNTLLAMAHLTGKDVNIRGVRFDFTPFLKNKVQVWPVYRNSQGVILEQRLADAGEKVYFFNPADFGVNFVANSVITSKYMAERRPDIVKIFINTLLNAWEAAMDPANAPETVRIIKKFDRTTSKEIIEKQLAVTRTLVKPSKSVRIGTINTQAWKQTEKIMLDRHQIRNHVHVEHCLMTVR
jgi:NitT/TauT family transport system substrate-binding protein